MPIASSLIFMRGMDIADESWNFDFAEDINLLVPSSFFGWLLICLSFQAARPETRYNYRTCLTQDSREDRASLFDGPLIIRGTFMMPHCDTLS